MEAVPAPEARSKKVESEPIAAPTPFQRRDPKKKPSFTLKLSDRMVSVGTNQKFTCQISLGLHGDNTGPTTIEWSKNGFPLSTKEGKIFMSFEDGTAVLEIRDTRQEDNGEYTCLAENYHGRASSSANLHVRGDFDTRGTAPTFSSPTFKARACSMHRSAVLSCYWSGSGTETREGDKLLLECTVTSRPMPSISWLKDGTKLPCGTMGGLARYQSSSNSGSADDSYVCKLAIRNPGPSDSGVYSCLAQNRIYKDEISTRLNIKPPPSMHSEDADAFDDEHSTPSAVRSPPRFLTQCLPDKYLSLGDTLALHVQVQGHPKPEVMWYLNSRVVPEQRKVKRMSVDDYEEDGAKTRYIFSLVVHNVTASDIGIYSCRASNSYGIARASCNVQFRAGAKHESQASVSEPEVIEDFFGTPPKFLSIPEEVIFVDHGESLTVKCKVKGQPPPTIRWLKDDRDITKNAAIIPSPTGEEDEILFSFHIGKVICADGGTYALEARNSWGCSTTYVTVRVRELQCPWDNKGAYPFDELYCKKYFGSSGHKMHGQSTAAGQVGTASRVHAFRPPPNVEATEENITCWEGAAGREIHAPLDTTRNGVSDASTTSPRASGGDNARLPRMLSSVSATPPLKLDDGYPRIRMLPVDPGMSSDQDPFSVMRKNLRDLVSQWYPRIHSIDFVL
ncbi:unnamed protein product [Notodromas monacha]|uniref:Ig-like domain-containing protein n=1 Tax=Notodromas monacha TaxID=399045 RepID=A0A7R9G9K3_9CRUS|nr:unnamed protein product [Notodromas monacha]CAG0914302.1 unnamed protein product [Notodromas monacha]